jgi:photosystem II stability/assembly factor-like uncharacterized protein
MHAGYRQQFSSRSATVPRHFRRGHGRMRSSPIPFQEARMRTSPTLSKWRNRGLSVPAFALAILGAMLIAGYFIRPRLARSMQLSTIERRPEKTIFAALGSLRPSSEVEAAFASDRAPFLMQGASWTMQTSGTTDNLLAVHFLNDCEGWAIGGTFGTIKRTVNCGLTWTTVSQSCGLFNYNSIHFLNSTTGWIGFEDGVARTTNTGSTWTCYNTFGGSPSIDRYSLFPISTDVAWGVGSQFSSPLNNFFRYNFSGTPGEERFTVAGGTTFYDIYCVDADNCWAVGAGGKIVRITGASGATPTFTQQTSGTTQQLNDVQMLDLNTGWVAGNGGTILTTTNGGATWTPQTSGTTAALRGIHFRNVNEGLAVGTGGVILATINGGASWSSESSGVTTDLENVFFSPNVAYAVGAGGKILKRTTAACTISVSPPSFNFPGVGGPGSLTITAPAGCGWNVADNVAWLNFTSATAGNGNGTVTFNVAANAGAARSGTITVTGEVNTIPVPVNQDFDCNLNLGINPVSFIYPAAGGAGTVNVTGLAQCNWTATPSDSWIQITSGGSGSGNGMVGYSVSANGGAQRSGTITIGPRTFTVYQVGSCAGPWCLRASGTSNALWSVHFLNDNEGWLAGANLTLRQTTDGGNTWTPRTVSGLPSSSGFYSVRFLDSNIGWVGGLQSVARTGNGGTSWTSRAEASTVGNSQIFPVSSTVAWAVGIDNGCQSHARYTFTGTTINSERRNVCPGSFLLDVYFTDPDNGWSVGSGGTIFRITNASGAFASVGIAPQTSNTSQWLYGIHMLDLNTGWAVGDGGTILKTVNGGAMWTPQTSGTTANLRDVHCINANECWAVGVGGLILRTINGGATWTPESSGVAGDLNSVFFPSANNGYAVGANGAILKRSTCVAPAISAHPASQTVCAGAPANFSVTASGTAPLSYQWRKNGANIPGATGSTYSISVAVGGDTGSYDVVVANACGNAPSNAATLTVNAATGITAHPAGQAVCIGAPASFSVAASGTGPFSYQWRKNGSAITGATGGTYTILSVVAGDAGNYDVVVSGACGTATSNIAALSINVSTGIAVQPASQTVCAGNSAGFTVVASGTGPFGYQWRKNGANIPGATGSAYTISSVVAGDAGNYDVVVTGACGSATSNPATLTVNIAPGVTTQPTDQTVCPSGTATFTAAASGSPAPTVQWQVSTDGGANFTNIPGATNPTLTLTNVNASQNGNQYRTVFTNACGMPMSTAAILTVSTSPTITTQPNSQAVCEAQSATFSVAATGAGPLTYQWRKNGTNIPGAIGSSYTIPSVTTADAAGYSVVVTGACGNVTSDTATLTVNLANAITLQPMPQTVCEGASATFSVTAGGTGPFTYQWRKNGVNIPGATGSTYTIASTTPADAATYDVLVTGSCNSVTSNGATLTVNAYAISPASQSFPASGGGGSVNVAAGAGCSWTVTHSCPWVTITSGSGGSGNGTINFTVGANPGAARSCTLTIAGKSFLITQAGTGPAGSWMAQTSGTMNNLFSVHFANNNLGWAVGASNTILRTIDGGVIWSTQSSPSGTPVTSYLGVRFIDANNGWLGGGLAVLRTADGGLNWTNVGADPSPFKFRNNLFAVSANVAWIPANSSGVPTPSRWFSRFTVPGAGEQDFNVLAGGSQYFDLYFTDADNGWAVGTGPIIRITNASGGAPSFGFQTSCPCPQLNGVFMLDANTGWAVGNGGLIFKTTNGGTNWNPQTSGTMTNLRSVHFVDANTGWAVGDGGTILVTTDGGGIWMSEASGVSTQLRRVFFPSANVGYAVGTNGAILKRTTCVAPVIASHPASQPVCAGAPASFSVVANGTAPLSYQWRKNGVNIPGATGSTYTINPAAAGDAGSYDVVVTGACGNATSNPATLTVNAATTINTHPISQTACIGTQACFSVTAGGTGPFTYQWRKNGANIPGATSSLFCIPSVAQGDAGNYDVVVTGACGVATSNAAILTVSTSPTITTQPSNQTVCEMQPATFSVVASGAGPLTYQWRKNGTNIPGATGSAYIIPSTTAADAAAYVYSDNKV